MFVDTLQVGSWRILSNQAAQEAKVLIKIIHAGLKNFSCAQEVAQSYCFRPEVFARYKLKSINTI